MFHAQWIYSIFLLLLHLALAWTSAYFLFFLFLLPAFKCWCQACWQYSLDYPLFSVVDGDVMSDQLAHIWSFWNIFDFHVMCFLQSKYLVCCRSFLNSAFELLLRVWAASRDLKVSKYLFCFLFIFFLLLNDLDFWHFVLNNLAMKVIFFFLCQVNCDYFIYLFIFLVGLDNNACNSSLPTSCIMQS